MMTKDLLAPFSHVRLESAGSTNDEIRRLALSGAAADFLVVSAIEQSAGRGRRGRAWVSPRGNLHFSVLVRISALAGAAQLGFAAAVALVDALSSLVPGPTFTAKWPNDILMDGRKVAGMLLEPVEQDWLIVGIGINVAAAPPPDSVLYPVAALAHAGFEGSDLDVLAVFCGAFAPWVESWRQKGFAPLRTAWTERARGIGAPVVVRLEAETLTGTFTGLDEEGALLLDAGSSVRRIMAGDVYFPPV